jgi:hypothetical protein
VIFAGAGSNDTATLLKNGLVLIAGGATGRHPGEEMVASVLLT